MTDINISHLANLAQLELSDTEQKAVHHDLLRIIGMVDQMQGIDTDQIEPLSHPLDVAARLRPDVVTESVDRDRYQAGAPSVADALYLVPRVVE